MISIKFMPLLLVLVFLCMEYDAVFVSAELRCKRRERKALLTFKQGLIDNYGILSSWGSEDHKMECCNWKGVNCSNTTGRVIGLQLQGDVLHHKQLRGKILPALLELHLLNNLDLSYNDFGGSRIPEFIGSMKKLHHLILHESNFVGIVPPQVGNLTDLQTLDLGNNRLKGKLPTSFAQLSKLEMLDVSFNSFEGIVSEANIMELPNLKVLDLSFNALTMNITPEWNPSFQLDAINLANCNIGPLFPTWLQTQSNFSFLDLSSAGILDEAPEWLWSLSPALQHLNLSHNQIRGTIPDLSSKSIRVIDVGSNKFSGPMPLLHPDTSIFQLSLNNFSGSISSICMESKYQHLLLLDLSNNRFTGELPNCWENMEELRVLNLAKNNFSGEISHTLGSLWNLKTLHLGDNNLSGEVPTTFKNFQNLTEMCIGGNKLTGNISKWMFANYTSMTYLSLRHNKFYGSIPPEICSLTQIRLLDFSKNYISGKIPRCFNNFTSFIQKNRPSNNRIPFPSMSSYYKFPASYLDYTFVQWKGQESEYRKILGLLKLIDLSSNRLVGTIPGELFHLKGLISLNLSRNALTGNMDPGIGQMEMLECLDLSRNQLTGEIPTGLAQLHYLQVLNLANNNLSGKIPVGTQLQSFNASVYAGNSELCGSPLALCPGDRLSSSITRDTDGKKDESFSLSFLLDFGASLACGFLVGFWGVINSLILKKSWRIAYFNFLDTVGNWLCVKATTYMMRFRRSWD